MHENGRSPPPASNHWLLVLCLVGVDYFSTLAYLPSIAVEAAGAWAPVAAGFVVLVTFVLALPVYWYVCGRSQDGRGAIGMVEELVPGWRGKFVVLALLGFASTDFVITRSLSLADAAVHLIHNQHGQQLLAGLPRPPDDWLSDTPLWSPLASLVRRLVEPQVAITLGLSVISFGFWQFFKRGASRQTLFITATAVACYLLLTAVVIITVLTHLLLHPEVWQDWLNTVFMRVTAEGEAGIAANHAWGWAWARMVMWSFPQMALGLSGFEMIMTVVPKIRGGLGTEAEIAAGRARNTRKLMLLATSIMAVYLISAVFVSTLAVPHDELAPGGAAEHRALAYLAHGSPLAANVDGTATMPLVGDRFGDLFDLSTVLVLCLAGVSVTMGLRNLLPHYLNRLGMEVSWAGRVAVIVHVINAVVLLITVVFRASPAAQQWAYTTSVLVLLAGAGLSAAKDLVRNSSNIGGKLLMMVAAGAGAFFLSMAGLTVLINASGLAIATAFVAAIVTSSMVSRWVRSTELRFEGFDFADDATLARWNELCHGQAKVLVPHRPGVISLAEKHHNLRQEYCLDSTTPIIFVEAELGDPSNFYHKPLMQIGREGQLEVIRVSRCVSVAHVLAAICLEMCRHGGAPPQVIFGWSHESPLAANLNFLLLGEGNIPWMVKELVRKSAPDPKRQPRIHIG